MRALVSAFALYASDHDDAIPYMGKPGAPVEWTAFRGRTYPFGDYFSNHIRAWPTMLWPHYLEDTGDDRHTHPAPGPYAELDAAGVPMSLVYSLFYMSATVAAAPAYWTGDAPPTNLSLFRATRRSEARFPANKGLLLDVSAWSLVVTPTDAVGVLPIAAFDGSAASHHLSLVDPQWVVERPFGSIPWRVIATRGGLAGRDF